MKANNNLTRVSCGGLNLVKLVNLCSDNNIVLDNLIRIDSKTIEFSVNDNDLKIFKSLDLQNYNVEIISYGGLKKFLKTIYFRMGLIIGVVLSIILLFFINNRLFNIQIWGLENVSDEEVLLSLEEYGLNKFDLMNFNSVDIENYLSQEFNFSFVSVITKGNSLIINIKEELKDVKTFESITSPYNMVITKINVFSGTSMLTIGDIVYAGDILVYPYEITNNERIDIEPYAEIEGETFFSERYEFVAEEDIYERTGKYKVVSSNVSLGNLKLFSNEDEHGFEHSEEQEYNQLVSSYFLPIKINKKIVFELQKVKRIRNFDDEKENIINNLKEKVYSKVPNNLAVDSEEIKISSTKYGNIVTIYLKSSVYLKYT